MLGITVFGQLAIVVAGLFIGLHYSLIQATQPFVGDFVIGTLGVATVLGYALIRASRNRVTRLLVRVAFVWTGIAFLAALAFAGQYLLSVAGFLIGDGTVWLSAGLLASVGYYRAKHPKARYHRVEGSYDKSVRLIQLTDLHIGDIWSENDLARIVRKASHYRPDCVVITGDLLDGMEPVDPDLVAPLGEFEVPVYFVSGNHDSYTQRNELLDALRDTGVTPLEGAIDETEAVSILGIGYTTSTEQQVELSEAFSKAKRPRIALKHKPDGLDSLLDATPDVILCGHVHYGQIWPLGYLGYIEFPQVEGARWYDQTMVHVSQGSATWGPPFRLGTRSEFTVLDLVAK